MAWIKSVGKVIKNIILLNNADYVCTSNNGGTNYTKIEDTMTYYHNGYATNYTDTPLIDITKMNTLKITGNCYEQGGQQPSGGNNSGYIYLLDSNGGLVATLFSISCAWNESSKYGTFNINYDVSNLTGYYKVRVQGISWYPNYTRYSFTEFEFDK